MWFSSTKVFERLISYGKNLCFTSHICCKGLSFPQTISLHHPCSTRRRLAMLGQCSQSVSLSLHSLQPPPSRLAQGCFSCVGFFPALSQTANYAVGNKKIILPTVHVLAAHSFHSFIHSSFLVIPAFLSFISFSTPRKSGSFTHSVLVITGISFLQSPHLPSHRTPILTTWRKSKFLLYPTALIVRLYKFKPRV